MILLSELVKYLDKLLHIDGLVDPSHNGLQVEGKENLNKIGFSVSASRSAIECAKEEGCDALIVHHGIFWGKDPQLLRGQFKEKVAPLIKNDISLIAYHLPLDIHQEVGNNWKAAIDLHWHHLEGFSPIAKNTHLGVKGKFKEREIEAFIKELEAYYNHSAAFALGGKKKVSSAALISGGAHKYIEQAAQEGVDCFITGSYDEPIWHLAHELKVNFIALGHYATERICIKAIQEHIEHRFGISCCYIDESNPF